MYVVCIRTAPFANLIRALRAKGYLRSTYSCKLSRADVCGERARGAVKVVKGELISDDEGGG